MPLHVRSIAISFAVICFFSIAIVGWINGLTQFVCCKRAVIGAVIAYVIATYAVKMANSILMNAIVKNLANKQEEQISANEK